MDTDGGRVGRSAEAGLTGRDWTDWENGRDPPIPNMTFYANVTIENNEFQDIRNMHLPAATEPTVSNAPVGIYLDHNPAGRPADLRCLGDPAGTIRIGPNDFININSNARTGQIMNHPARRDEGYPQIYPDDYEFFYNGSYRHYYDFPLAIFPRHLYDVILNCFGAYGELSHAIWHVPPADIASLEEADMWNWSMIAHETTCEGDEDDEDKKHAETTEYILDRHRVTVDDCINRKGADIDAGLGDAAWVRDR